MFSSVYSNSSRTYYSSNMPDVNVKKVSNNMNLNTIIRLANTPYYDYVTAPVHTPNMNMNTIFKEMDKLSAEMDKISWDYEGSPKDRLWEALHTEYIDLEDLLTDSQLETYHNRG